MSGEMAELIENDALIKNLDENTGDNYARKMSHFKVGHLFVIWD